MGTTNLLEHIREVWGDSEDFEEGGFPYVSFIIEQDLQDMKDDDWDAEECTEELADIAINSLRALDELGDGDPETIIHDRLNDRMDGQTGAIIEKYTRLYDESE